MAVTRRLPPLPSTRDILRMYNIKATKKLSQNFILDPRILDKIARVAGPLLGKTVIEVGPGPGGITRAIIGNGAREVHAVEKDMRFMPSLNLLREASGGILNIHPGDVLNFNMTRLLPEELRTPWETSEVPPITIIGNLPFNISTPLVIKYLKAMQEKTNIYSYGRVPCTFTFQDEVAHRMMAGPGDRTRCRFSIFCQNYARVQYRYFLDGGAFVPPPKVNVGLVTLTPLVKPYIDVPFRTLEKLVTAVFNTKNKELRNASLKIFPPSSMNRFKRVDEMLEIADLHPTRKVVSLTMSEWEKFVLAFQYMVEQEPKLDTYIHPEIRVQLSDYKARSYPEDGVLIGESEPKSRSLSEVEEEIVL